ncbi:MAG TPA: cation-transporting P-type ATPase [Chloroflexota bacterium]|nr:cation-transporting P-type ATPase [Chloroflexota bacterium]
MGVDRRARTVPGPLAETDRVTLSARAGGLSSSRARQLLAEVGPNRLVPSDGRPSLIAWLARALADPMVLLLLVAGVTYLVLGDQFDAIVVLVAVVPIVGVGLLLEARAERALDQLKQLIAPTATVWRDGHPLVIAAEEIVSGDLVEIREGDVVPADGTLVEAPQIMLDESALTGESLPVSKDLDGQPAERQVFAGTTVVSGRAAFEVTATGSRTRYGRVGELVGQVRSPATPLQRMIRRLVWRLAAIAGGFCAAVAGAELLAGHGWAAAIIAGVSLAMAAVPEEFPMVYTLYLSLGAWRLARDHALVRNLASVETLGAATVICTDKTGTLTYGRLDVVKLATTKGIVSVKEPLAAEERALLEAAVLASEPNPFDPLERAILANAVNRGIDVDTLHAGSFVADYPFEPKLKYVAHVWKRDGDVRITAKGSLEGILQRSQPTSMERQRAIEMNQLLAAEGLRVIAVAGGSLSEGSVDRDADESHLRFVGLIAFADPLREGVASALGECQTAGIRVIMLTGDHPVTAHAVAEGLALPHSDQRPVATGDDVDAADQATLVRLVRDVSIFARIRPEQKHRIVQALRAQGHVVAMTGDGINDAPSLREADIGIAMGQRGTEVAREAADLVLLDDNFATIVAAIHGGRRIFENLRRAFAYLVAFHAPLLLGALVIPMVGAPLLLLPVVLIWLELVVHPVASLVFDNDPAAPDLMRRPPRPPGAELFAGRELLRPLVQGVSLSVGILALYLVLMTQGIAVPEARGVAVAALLLGQLVLVLSARSPTQPLWHTSVRGNRALWPILVVTTLSLVAVLYIPAVAAALELAPFGSFDWLIAAAVAALTTLWLEPLKGRTDRR